MGRETFLTWEGGSGCGGSFLDEQGDSMGPTWLEWRGASVWGEGLPTWGGGFQANIPARN